MIEDCVIIGGGVAGLSAANRLADAGISPLIIEASTYPSQRMCGEFFSYECLPLLHSWDIELPQRITHCRFIRGENEVAFVLPSPSQSCSRYVFDIQLLERAQKKGARVLTQTKVLSLSPPKQSTDNFQLTLSNGEKIEARHLMIGTGRLPKMGEKQGKTEFRYTGFKAHFSSIPTSRGVVEMHSFDGGYLGVSSIDQGTTNVACLVDKKKLMTYKDPIHFLDDLLQKKTMRLLNKQMSQARMLFPQWLVGDIPEFGIRQNPSIDRIFWMGDAAGSIPPISGEGLAIAITSGCMAADYFLGFDAHAFKKAWLKRYEKRFYMAMILHKMMLKKGGSYLAFKACQTFPSLPSYLWSCTRSS